MSNYAEIKNFDIANAPGISVTVFLSGCDANPKCKGCFNSIAWDKDYGTEIDNAFYKEVYKMLNNEHIHNLVLLGGDPLAPWNLDASCRLIECASRLKKKIWVYTWRPFEEVSKYKDLTLYDALSMYYEGNKIPFCYDYIIYQIDVLVDGRFIEEQKDLTLKWKGSKNQRVIDVKKTIKNNWEVVLYD